MQLEIKPHHYTPEEYLELEEKAEFRNEYRDGEIIPMTGGTTNHNKIALNLAVFLKMILKAQDYEIYISDVRLWVPRYRQYTYPNVMVIAGEPVYTGTNTTTVMNPCLITEVLSKSPKNYDQGDKFTYYRSIPEFKEYILIDQYNYHVMQYVKTAECQWLFTETETQSATLSIQTLNVEIALSDIYERVNFTDNNEES
ncbi:Uma2 family endonuclease [Nostoc sp. FACHB-87]|uniref:Uma2 family endonuclease n=1 Tax=Nostocaceae TaxID=1162 RepID=UPI00168970A4|nr:MULTISPECIES: Uma2 family endonuclease [Nostocaceae]MBD2457735.1 Uma2 family endonuclease [Nostoc sp. FACHB-87]MBD2478195.1 Uma2 family endonuclease [Anabaena sp. FACHB-83]